jgi:putative hemolysin
MVILELLVILLLLLVNGFFAMSELAVVSSRKARLMALADRPVRGARAALALAEDPGRFLSAVQVGITLVGVLAGAFGGATIAARIVPVLLGWGVPLDIAQPLSLATVVVVLTYLSLIVGELVPKRVALGAPERIASSVARPMTALARVATPVVWLLEASTNLVLRLLGRSSGPRHVVTEEEVKALVSEAESSGTVEPQETQMIGRVMRLGDQTIRAAMTPRHEIEWLDLDQPREQLVDAIRRADHSYLPVARGTVDEAQGVIMVRRALAALAADPATDLSGLIEVPPAVHDNATLLSVLEILRGSTVDTLFVVDEYGTLEGLATPVDILGTIAGEFTGIEVGEDEAVQREDGTWLLDGMMSVERMAEVLDLQLERERDYHTVAGFVLERMRRLPRIGEAFEWQGWRFEVIDLDNRRIDRVEAKALPRPATRDEEEDDWED